MNGRKGASRPLLGFAGYSGEPEGSHWRTLSLTIAYSVNNSTHAPRQNRSRRGHEAHSKRSETAAPIGTGSNVQKSEPSHVGLRALGQGTVDQHTWRSGRSGCVHNCAQAPKTWNARQLEDCVPRLS